MEAKEVVGKDGLHYCSVCGQTVERILQFPVMDGTDRTIPRKVRVSCKCRQEEVRKQEAILQYEEEQRAIDRLKKLSLIDERLKDVRFDTYERDQYNEKAFRIAIKYVNNFDRMFEKGQGILFFGDVGTGKSYTAAAIANELMQRRYSVIMTSFINLLRETKDFDSDESGTLDRLNRAKLLIVDDLGAERGTDYALEKVYDIIDSRYRTGKPIILTTNLNLREMQQCTDIRYNRIYDRIFEMCYPVKVEGRSWRKKKAVERFDDMKRLFDE